MKLAEIKELTEFNPTKYNKSYYEIKEIQSKFDSVYNLIDKKNLDVNPILKNIYETN